MAPIVGANTDGVGVARIDGEAQIEVATVDGTMATRPPIEAAVMKTAMPGAPAKPESPATSVTTGGPGGVNKPEDGDTTRHFAL